MKNKCLKKKIGFWGNEYEEIEHDWSYLRADGEGYRVCQVCDEKEILWGYHDGFEVWRKTI